MPYGQLAGYEIGLLSFGLSPFAILALAGLVVAGYLFAARFDDATANRELGWMFAASAATVLLITLLLCLFCVQIRPRELFVDVGASDPTTQLLADISAAEADVCKLITRADQFIQNDVGKAGQDDPTLVTAAQQKARGDTDMVVCGGDLADQLEIDHRLRRMEETLRAFTEPEFSRTYDATVPCHEGFVDISDEAEIASARQRLAAIRTTIQEQQRKYLGPIDAKTAAMQRGDLSDCERRRGAKTATAASVVPKGSSMPS